jgi:formiminotetrahydrofolate cyclodeaminase
VITNKPLRDVLAAFSSPAPTPGGGSAAALASALGSSLLLMVAGLSNTRSDSDDDRSALAAAATALTGIQQQLTEAVDADSTAYDQVIGAYRLPRASEREQATRKAAVQRALRAATDVPLGVMRLSVDALKHAQAVAAHGKRAAASDVGVGLALLQAGLEGARLNVRINLAGIADEAYVDAVNAESERLAGRMWTLVRDAIASMG